jgi:molybdate transport system substrate-binding protein
MVPFAWVLGIGLVILGCGCSREPGATERREVRVLCGSSMAEPVQEIGRLFQESQAVQVLVDLGGSETLLPRVVTGAPADVFVCHDPFEQKVKDAGRWAGSAWVGRLRPVLLVRPGNPGRIRSLADLANRHLKIGIGDPQYSTCGTLFVQRLGQAGLRERVMPQVVLQGRTHAEIANGLILGPLDAAVVWNYVAVLYPGKVEEVPTSDSYPEVRVTVVGLTQSQNPEARDLFLRFCGSKVGKAIFAKHGYGPPAPD